MDSAPSVLSTFLNGGFANLDSNLSVCVRQQQQPSR